MNTPGKRFRSACHKHAPLAIVGTINAYSALLAERAGFEAIYLSGAGVANASYGLPDLAVTNLNDVLIDVDRITQATQCPLLVDVDTGWGSRLTIARTTQALISRGAAGMHIEDQTFAKRCGHRPGKSIVSLEEMCDRVKAAVDARVDPDFVIMARTDAFAKEGLSAAIERAQACVEAGADMIFPEALQKLDDYKSIVDAVNVPVLANITEFGKTPLFTRQELGAVGVGCVLYPLSAFRAMSRAAETVYHAIYAEGSQGSVVSMMQTRDELYDVLHYHEYEKYFDSTNE